MKRVRRHGKRVKQSKLDEHALQVAREQRLRATSVPSNRIYKRLKQKVGSNE